MQTFSYLQRSSYDENNLLKYAIFGFFLLIYEPLGTIYLFFPPLFGLILWLFFKDSAFEIKMFALLYLYVFEIDHSMARFSLFITLFLALYMLRHLFYLISSKLVLQILGVAIFYTILVMIEFGFSFIVKVPMLFDPFLFLYYTIVDFIIVVVYEK